MSLIQSLSVVLLVAFSTALGGADDARPSIVFLFSDDLTTQALEEAGHLLHLVEDDEFSRLFVQIEIRFGQDLPVGFPFEIKVDRWLRRSDIESKRGLPDLSGAQKDNGGLGLQRGVHAFVGLASVHTLQLLHHVEDLQG